MQKGRFKLSLWFVQTSLQKNEQHAEPNDWIEDSSWLIPTDISYEVPFKKFKLTSKLDRIDILGYKKDTKNYLNLFDIKSVNPKLIKRYRV